MKSIRGNNPSHTGYSLANFAEDGVENGEEQIESALAQQELPHSLDGGPSEVHFAFFEAAEDDALQSDDAVSRLFRSFPAMQYFAGAGVPLSIVSLARLVMLLSFLGLIAAGFIFLVDLSVHATIVTREYLSVTLTGGSLGFIIYVCVGVLLCLMSTLVCRLISTDAEGSGIPQMKAIMSGFYDKCKASLSMWTLVAKSIGLVCAIGGGLPVGWEGPNVHMSCIMSHHLLRLPVFRDMRKDRALRMQIMATACAVGLASSFGSPIGGVLYGLETTTSFYLVPTFWKSVLATVTGAMFYDILYKTPLVAALENTSFAEEDYRRGQLIAFGLMGCLMGLLGALFVKCVHWLYDVRKRKAPGTNRYLLVGGVALVSAVLTYHSNLLRMDPREAINSFFSSDLDKQVPMLQVITLLAIKFPLVIVSIGLPVPCGVFVPCFLLGSGLGRLVGEALRYVFGTAFVPGGYAVVGAAAFTAGVTRALSCAVIIFEVTGQLRHIFPSLVAVLLAVIVGNTFNRGLYDTLIIMKELPFMPHLKRSVDPAAHVGRYMTRDLITLPELVSVSQTEYVLQRYPDFDAFPVVALKGGVIGETRRHTLINAVSRARHADRVIDLTVPSKSKPDDLRGDLTDSLDVTTTEVPLTPTLPITPSESETIPPSENEQAPDNISAHQTPAADDTLQNGVSKASDPIAQRKFDVPVDIAPLTVTENMTLSKLHFLFVMLMPTHALVTSRGKLVGVVRRRDIIVGYS